MEKNNKTFQKKWVCVEVTHRYNKSQHVKTVKDFLKTLFKDNQVLFVGSDLGGDNFKNTLDGYFFIQCQDITPYIQAFKDSKYISNILVSYDSVSYINDYEVKQLIKSYEQKCIKQQTVFNLGDIVKIKTGIFKNLYGLVVDSNFTNTIKVMLKFISGYRFQEIKIENCEKQNNFFDYIRKPVK